jgi:hypothetical protein
MKIFISYRRADSKYVVDRIRDRLITAFGNQSVFRDVESIPIGVDFRTELENVASSCDVMLVVIGPQWAGITDAQGNKRLFDANDFTRIEIETGLRHEGIRVVPVLVMNADMPTAQEMPESLKDLAFRNAVNVRNDPDFDNDIQRLILGINQLQSGVVEPIVNGSEEGNLVVPSKIKAAKHLEALPAREKSATGKPAQKRSPLMLGIIGGVALLTMAIVAGVFLLGNNRSSPVASTGMVRISAGNYTMGTNTPVEVAEFWIDRYEVTNSDYAKFIDGTGNNPPAYWTGGDIPPGLREHPVAQIKWEEAREYCSWVGKRLPTEAEWEVAARGPFGWLYPWGNNPDGVRRETRSTRPVDDNPANRSYFGAYYMSGNVWEWVDDPFTQTAENEHIMRGGAYGPLDVLTTPISIADNGPVTEKAGFRCAASGENVIRRYDEALALDDNFDSSNTNWPGIHEDKFLFDYHEVGYYHVEAKDANKFISAFYEHDTFSNFVMETGVFVDKANTDNQQGNFLYGLGVQVTEGQFYAFLVSAKDQKWQVVKGTLNKDVVIGDTSDLTVITSGTDPSIRGMVDDKEDRLAIIANGTELMYLVNGNLVYVLTVEDHQKVKVGFIVETLDDVTKVHIHYNWVTLQKIDPFDNGDEKQTSLAVQPTPTIAPTLAPPSATSTFAPPVTPYVRILGITVGPDQNYVVEYETFGYTEERGNLHVHFFFDTVLPEQAGAPASGPWIVYYGPRPFTKYAISNRPSSAIQMCALVANSNHSIQLKSGNCMDLPPNP